MNGLPASEATRSRDSEIRRVLFGQIRLHLDRLRMTEADGEVLLGLDDGQLARYDLFEVEELTALRDRLRLIHP